MNYSPGCFRSEERAGQTICSVRGELSHSEPHSIPQQKFPKDEIEKDKYKQDEPAPQYRQDEFSKDVCEYLFCPENMEGEESSPHREERDVDTSGLKNYVLTSEQIKLNYLKYGLNDSSSQTRMNLQGSTVMLSEESYYCRSSGEASVPPVLNQASNLTVSPFLVYSHTVSETPMDHEAGEGLTPSPRSSIQNTKSDPMQQFVDCLPTFTSQRPPDLPTTTGKLAPSNTWSVSNTAQWENR